MKIVENTPHRLVMEHRSLKLAVLLSLAVLFCVGATLGLIQNSEIWWGLFILFCSLAVLVPVFLVGIEHTQLILDATARQFVFRRKTLTGWDGEWGNMGTLLNAAHNTNSSGEYASHRPVLLFTQAANRDPLPLITMLSTDRNSRKSVSIINTWLTAYRASLDSGTTQD